VRADGLSQLGNVHVTSALNYRELFFELKIAYRVADRADGALMVDIG
jgi:hypothetical protein